MEMKHDWNGGEIEQLLKVERRKAYEEMRERAATAAWQYAHTPEKHGWLNYIRSLPLPKDED